MKVLCMVKSVLWERDKDHNHYGLVDGVASALQDLTSRTVDLKEMCSSRTFFVMTEACSGLKSQGLHDLLKLYILH